MTSFASHPGAPYPTAPIWRRRPIPPMSTFDEFDRVAKPPNAMRLLMFFLGLGLAVFAIAVGVALFTDIPRFAFAVLFTLVSLLAFRLLPRVLRRRDLRPVHEQLPHGVLCDVFPTDVHEPGQKAGVAILVDVRMADSHLPRVLHACSARLDRYAADPAAPADLFGADRVVPAERLVGPDGRGAYFVRDSEPDDGWRLLLPESGMVITINQPTR